MDVDEEADDFELRHYTDTPLKFLRQMEEKECADDKLVADLENGPSSAEQSVNGSVTCRKWADKHVEEAKSPVVVAVHNEECYMTPKKANSQIVIEEEEQPVIANEVEICDDGVVPNQVFLDDRFEYDMASVHNNEIIEPKVLPELRLPSVMPGKK